MLMATWISIMRTICEVYPYLAESPDGMFVCNCCPPPPKKVDFLEQVDGNLMSKPSHGYYAQVQGQMWLCGVQRCYFILWMQFNKPVYEIILFDHTHCDSLVNRLTIFYKTYDLPCLLGFRELQECPQCEKVLLQESEVNNPAEKYSITCCTCCTSKTSWHLCCSQVTETTAKSSESWLCFGCLADTCNTGGDDFDYLSSEGDDVNIGASSPPPNVPKSQKVGPNFIQNFEKKSPSHKQVHSHVMSSIFNILSILFGRTKLTI